MKLILRWSMFGIVMVGAVASLAASLDLDRYLSPAHPAIQYFKTPPDDPIARLAKKMEAGEVTLDYVPGRLGYLPSLLKNLDVNIDSQLLVFSKTSFQAPLISPHAPRALFFDDTVFVGSVQNSDILELAALDPKQGIVFYTMSRRKDEKP